MPYGSCPELAYKWKDLLFWGLDIASLDADKPVDLAQLDRNGLLQFVEPRTDLAELRANAVHAASSLLLLVMGSMGVWISSCNSLRMALVFLPIGTESGFPQWRANAIKTPSFFSPCLMAKDVRVNPLKSNSPLRTCLGVESSGFMVYKPLV